MMLKRWVWIILMAMALSFLAALTLRGWFAAESLPDLDAARFAEARAAWEQAQPDNYRITIEVTGRQPAVYSVEVRFRQAIAAFRNGEPLADERTFRTWSVDGMFDTMETDVDRNAASEDDPPLLLRARFDEQWHYPAEYLRVEWGTSFEVAWRVTAFEVIDEPAPRTDAS